MPKDLMSCLEIAPRTDDPHREAIDLTNAFKDRIQQITAAQCIHAKSFDDYLNETLSAPRQPSERSARSKAKSHNGLHFWSKPVAWIKSKLFTDDTSYADYKAKRQQMESDADIIYQRDCERYNREYADYQEERSRLTSAFQKLAPDVVDSFFEHILINDQFSIDYFNTYRVAVHSLHYDKDQRCLYVHYRIPGKGEILPLDYFFYDDEYQAIRDRQLTVGIAADYRNDIARRVLLRVAATLFMSDDYNMVDTIELHGFLEDDSTDGRIITVISLVIPRNEIMGKNPEFISTRTDFIEIFQEERSPDLYKAESYQLRELLSRPRIQKKDSIQESKVISKAKK